MSEYIDKQKLKKHYAWWNNENQRIFDQIVDVMPLEDVKPIVHGEWRNVTKGMDYMHYATCSVCGQRQLLECMNFCPYCGADMGVYVEHG